MALISLIEPKADWEYLLLSNGNPAPDGWAKDYGGWTYSGAPYGNYYGTWGGRDDFLARTYWPADGWDGDDLLVRKAIDLTGVDLATVKFYIGTDNGMTLYVNGNKVTQRNDEGYAARWEYQGVVPQEYLINGTNIIAVALEDHGGLTAFDMQLTGEKDETPTPRLDDYTVAVEKNSVLITYSTPIQLLGSEFDTESIKVFVDGALRTVKTGSVTTNPRELKLTLYGRELDSAARVALEYNLPSGGSQVGYVASAPPLRADRLDLKSITIVDTLRTASSVNNRGLGLAYKNVVLTGALPISGIGNTLDNNIIGNAAANLIDGREGSDMLQGGAGDDIYIVDSTADSIVENANAGTDVVISRVSYALSSNIEKLDLDGSALGFVNRNTHADALGINGTGNALNNTITGNKYSNILDGLTGVDTLIGGYGSDTYIVDNVSDQVIEDGSWQERDTLYSSVSRTLEAGVENLMLTGAQALNGTGNALDNILNGNSANNIIDGISGSDTLTGGAGVDTFKVSTVVGRGSYTTITDMVVGSAGDKISLSKTRLRIAQSSSRPFTYRSVNNDNDFNSSHSSNIMFIYNAQTGDLLYNENGIQRGLGSGGIIANLSNRPSLMATDILFG